MELSRIDELLDLKSGRVSPQIYTDEGIYRLELHKIFGTAWLFLGHESHIAEPGDFMSSYMGEDQVLVVRAQDGAVRVFLNQCRHRGMKICRAENGNARAFTCTYHGWTYDLQGRLQTVPHQEEYPDDFDTRDWGARTPAKVSSYRGFIFATWDSGAPELTDFLGGAAAMLDSVADRTAAGSEFVKGVHKWTIECNWKMPSEQFASDMYHAAISHVSAAMIFPGGRDLEKNDLNRHGQQYITARGHGGGSFSDAEVNPAFYVAEPVRQYLIEHAGEAVERLGEDLGRKVSGHNTIFPNFSYLSGMNTFRVWHPRGPNKIEVWSWILVDKDAPQDVKDAWRRGGLRTFGPSGVFEQDDGENWVQVQKMHRGAIAQETPLCFQMGLGQARTEDPATGMSNGRLFSDEAARNFYGHWAELLQADQPSRSVQSAGRAEVSR